MSELKRFEWPTWGLLILCYGSFGFATTWLAGGSLPLAIVVTILSVALHSSLSHEVLHGHPFRNKHLNAALVFPAISFFIPYMRFRDTHLAHHEDSRLTDPYDDPESCYLDPAVWATLSAPMRGLFRINNTLAGRLLLGPLVGQIAFMLGDFKLIRDGDKRVLISWLWHIPAAAMPILWLIYFGAMPLWAFFVAVYFGTAVLKIRTFLEHQAHHVQDARTVIIADRGLLALLFLNNNFHSVHHLHPGVPWYALPALFRAHKERFLEINEGYYYSSYVQVFRSYFFKAKEPVPHPLWSSQER
ncbi:fatty acid desaturase [Planktotalea sp.]|uniref:fatty acid desaturase n=1 Tax=Planktotalea sp. TaxID=2029877 RepID=UPI003D6A41C9